MVQKRTNTRYLPDHKKLPLNPLKGIEQASKQFVKKIKSILTPKLLLKMHNTLFFMNFLDLEGFGL